MAEMDEAAEAFEVDAQRVAQAAAAIRKASRVVFFTGAGMSAESGIATFRGKSGVWNGIRGALILLYGGTPLGWNLTPGIVWRKFASEFHDPIVAAHPHPGHVAITRIQRLKGEGAVRVVTMNVDGLHQAAGSSHVSEVHGSVRRFVCRSCREPAQVPLPLPRDPPRCGQCQGRVRPDVTLFGEALPEDQFDAAHAAMSSLKRGDVVVMVGTTSVVYPAAGLPELAHQRGATIIEVNVDPQPSSHITQLFVRGAAGLVLDSLANILNAPQL